jgi:hypothetical protein
MQEKTWWSDHLSLTLILRECASSRGHTGRRRRRRAGARQGSTPPRIDDLGFALAMPCVQIGYLRIAAPGAVWALAAAGGRSR